MYNQEISDWRDVCWCGWPVFSQPNRPSEGSDANGRKKETRRKTTAVGSLINAHLSFPLCHHCILNIYLMDISIFVMQHSVKIVILTLLIWKLYPLRGELRWIFSLHDKGAHVLYQTNYVCAAFPSPGSNILVKSLIIKICPALSPDLAWPGVVEVN